MNLTQTILKAASGYSDLTSISLENNRHYIGFQCKALDQVAKPIFFIVAHDPNRSPSTLDEPCAIKLEIRDRQRRGLTFPFQTVADALIALNTPVFRFAALWSVIDHLDPCDHDLFIDAYCMIDVSLDAKMDQLNLTAAEYSDLVLKQLNTRIIKPFVQLGINYPDETQLSA